MFFNKINRYTLKFILKQQQQRQQQKTTQNCSYKMQLCSVWYCKKIRKNVIFKTQKVYGQNDYSICIPYFPVQ